PSLRLVPSLQASSYPLPRRFTPRVAGAALSRLAGGKEEAMATKQARVSWKGDLENGTGTIEQVGSGALGPLAVSWAARTGDESGMTSPEELIAAAHASCFSMAFSARLPQAGAPPPPRGGGGGQPPPGGVGRAAPRLVLFDGVLGAAREGRDAAGPARGLGRGD